MRVYATLAALCAIAGIALPFFNVPDPQTASMVRLQMALQSPNVLGAIAAFFVIPAVARTERPDFRLTFERFLGIVGIGIAVGVVVQVASLFLLIPGVWIAVKWSLTTWCYLLSDGKNPFGESWEITNRRFWSTLGCEFALALVAAIVLFGLFFGAAALAIAVPVAGVLLLPVAFFGYVFAAHVALLGQMRLMLALRQLRAPSAPMAMPA